MKTCWFVVIKSGDNWWVDNEGTAYGPFDSESAARDNAVDLAEAFGDPHRRNDVYVRGGDGSWQLIWSGDTASKQTT